VHERCRENACRLQVRPGEFYVVGGGNVRRQRISVCSIARKSPIMFAEAAGNAAFRSTTDVRVYICW